MIAEKEGKVEAPIVNRGGEIDGGMPGSLNRRMLPGLSVAMEKTGEEGFAGAAGSVFEGGEPIEGLGVFGIDFEDAAIQGNGTPRKAHGFVEFAELKVSGSVPLVEFDGE